MRVGLVVDSACDLPQDFLDRHRIVVMPITIHVGSGDLVDTRDPGQTRDFYASHLGKNGGARSSALSPEQMRALFLDRLVVEYDYVFCLTIASSRSPIFENARKASLSIGASFRRPREAAQRNGPFAVRVIDTQNLFAAQGVLAVEAVRMIRAGENPAKIRERLDYLAYNTHGYMLPRDLYYLRSRAQKKGDKSVGWMQYALGTALDIKPLVKGYRNDTRPCARLRHFESGAEKLFDFAAKRVQRGLQAPVLVVSYGGEMEELEQLPGYAPLQALCRERNVDFLASRMSVTGAINVGEGALSLAFADEPHEFAA